MHTFSTSDNCKPTSHINIKIRQKHKDLQENDETAEERRQSERDSTLTEDSQNSLLKMGEFGR